MIVSARNKAFFVAAVLSFILGGAYAYLTANADCVKFGTIECLQVEQVSNKDELIRGLSYRDNLSVKSGMLFDMQTDDFHCFWMKDMRFAIDMIWLDADGKVIDIKADATPESYPNQFCPQAPARYVLEVNSGATAAAGVAAGSQLKL